MSRYGPQVLPEAYGGLLAGALGNVIQGVSGGLDERERRRRQAAEDARVAAADARAEEDQRQRRALFQMQLGERGAVPTQDFRTTQGRHGEVGSAVARELTAPPLNFSTDPGAGAGGIATGVAGAINRGWANVQGARQPAAAPMQNYTPGGGNLRYEEPMPLTPEQRMRQRGPTMEFRPGDDEGPGGALAGRFAAPPASMPLQPLAQELGGPRAPAAAAGPQSVRSYLNYEDRAPGMKPYEVGEYTIDPMLAYDRSRAGARMQEQEETDRLRGELGGVDLSNPAEAATRLLRAGKLDQAIKVLQVAEAARRETGVMTRSNRLSDLAQRRLENDYELRTAAEEGRATGHDIELLSTYERIAAGIRAQITGLRASQEDLRPALVNRLADAEKQIDEQRARMNLTARERPGTR